MSKPHGNTPSQSPVPFLEMQAKMEVVCERRYRESTSDYFREYYDKLARYTAKRTTRRPLRIGIATLFLGLVLTVWATHISSRTGHFYALVLIYPIAGLYLCIATLRHRAKASKLVHRGMIEDILYEQPDLQQQYHAARDAYQRDQAARQRPWRIGCTVLGILLFLGTILPLILS